MFFAKLEQIKIMDVIAQDEEGNEFTKKVVLLRNPYVSDDLIVSFGGPVEYSWKRTMLGNYPFPKPLCIDMGGRNHGGVPNVEVSADNMNKIVEKVNEILDVISKEEGTWQNHFQW